MFSYKNIIFLFIGGFFLSVTTSIFAGFSIVVNNTTSKPERSSHNKVKNII